MNFFCNVSLQEIKKYLLTPVLVTTKKFAGKNCKKRMIQKRIFRLSNNLVLLHDALTVIKQALDLWKHDKAFQDSNDVSCQGEQVGPLTEKYIMMLLLPLFPTSYNGYPNFNILHVNKTFLIFLIEFHITSGHVH